MASILKQAGYWHLYYSCLPGCPAHPAGGQRHHQSTGLRDRKAAELIKREFEEAQEIIRARLRLGLSANQGDPNLTISQLADRYYHAMQGEKSPRTIQDADKPAINHLIKTLGDLPLHSVDASCLRMYQDRLLQRDRLKPATWNSRRSILRALWNWAIREQLVTANPWKEVGKALDHEDDHRLKRIPRTALQAVLSECPGRDWQLIVLFLYQSMCRLSEMINLLRADVNRTNHTITFRRPKERTNRTVKPKIIPLTPELLSIMNEAESRCESDYVFSRKERFGRRLDRHKITQVLNKIGKRIGTPVSPHRLRKSGASDSNAGGSDIRTIQLLLGHSDIRTTEKYVLPDSKEKQAAMQRLNVGGLLNITNTRFQKFRGEALRRGGRKPKDKVE